MIETFFCTSPIWQLHAWRTGEAGKSNAEKVGYAKILYTFKKPQYSFLLFHCKHDLGGIRTLLQLRHPLHNPRPLLLQQVKARTGGAEGGCHMAHGKAGTGEEGTGGSPKQLIQGVSDWKFEVNIQILLLPTAVVSFPTWLGDWETSSASQGRKN